jgi:hypothetical protein
MHFNPEDINAAADLARAVEEGFAMRHRKPEPVPEPPAAALPFPGITGTQYLIGIAILSLALLGVAVIIHRGLVA